MLYLLLKQVTEICGSEDLEPLLQRRYHSNQSSGTGSEMGIVEPERYLEQAIQDTIAKLQLQIVPSGSELRESDIPEAWQPNLSRSTSE